MTPSTTLFDVLSAFESTMTAASNANSNTQAAQAKFDSAEASLNQAHADEALVDSAAFKAGMDAISAIQASIAAFAPPPEQ